MDATKVDTAKYLAVNELEAKGAWIRYFKFVCAIWGAFCIVAGVYYAIEYITSPLTFVLLGNAVLSVLQAIVYGLQAKAIQNVDFDLQKNLVRFFYFNTIAAPCWVTLGPLISLGMPQIFAGLGTFVFCGVMLIFSFQVKRVFENKKAFVLTAEDCA